MEPDKRIRGRRLQRIRRSHLSAYPLCVMCESKGLVRAATEVDHITALHNGGADTDGNRQGLCKDCHAIKTAQDMGYTVRVVVGLDGWPA